MNAPATWYNAERVSQPGSAILTAWRAEREATRAGQLPQAAVPVSTITRGTEMFDLLTGGFGMMGAGVPVTEQTALCVSAVYACVGLIGGANAPVVAPNIRAASFDVAMPGDDTVDGLPAQPRVVDDAPTAEPLTADLELRLDQRRL